MTYFLFISSIVIGLVFRKSRVVSIYILSSLYILAVYKYNCADLENYRLEYNFIQEGIFTEENARYIGFFMIQSIAVWFKLDFLQFLQLFYLICFVVLYVAVRKMTAYVNVVFALFTIFPFGIEVIQMKTFMADCFVLLGLSFLFAEETKIRKKSKYANFILFIIFLLIAICIHFSAVYFMIVGTIFILSDKRKYKRVITFGSIVGFIMTCFDVFPALLKRVSAIVPGFDFNYIIRWMSGRMHWGIILIILATLMIIFTSQLIFAALCKNFFVQGSYYKYQIITDFICSVFILLPLIMYDMTFDRLFRVFIILIFILAAEVPTKVRTMKKVYANTGILFMLAVMYWIDISKVYDITLGAILKFNSIL